MRNKRWPKKKPLARTRDGSDALAGPLRYIEKVVTSFPDTKPKNMTQRSDAVMRRRAANKRARRARKRNR